MTHVPTGWRVTKLKSGLQITCHDAPPLEDYTLDRQIEVVWQKALKTHPNLYNGRVFCLSGLSTDRLEGFWCEYRWVLAQMRSPALGARLKLRPLAVTALLICLDGVVLGRRNPNALYLPGQWQGVPAGSVEARHEHEPIDLAAQLFAELAEEIGLQDRVSLSEPLLTCEHDTTHIVDLGFVIETSHSFSTIRAAWQARANNEYDALQCHSWADVNQHKTRVLPTTRALLEHFTP